MNLLLKPISLLKRVITSAGASGAGTVIKQQNAMRHLMLRLAQVLKSFIWSIRDVVQVPFVKLRLIAWSKPVTRGYFWLKSSTFRVYQLICLCFLMIFGQFNRLLQKPNNYERRHADVGSRESKPTRTKKNVFSKNQYFKKVD